MKRVFQSGFLFLSAAIILFSSCKKTTTPGGGGGRGIVSAMYPVSVSSYDGNNSAYPTVNTYTYDNNNLLTKWGSDSAYREVSVHGVNQVVYFYPYMTVTSYLYKIANQIDTSVSIYDGSPTEVKSTFFTKNVIYQTTTSKPQDDYFRENNGNGLLLKEISDAGGGLNINYTYDDKQNLQKIEWVSLSGTHAGLPYARLTVTGYDNKFSPFAAVKGWKIASWPQAYPEDFALAYAGNNPTQIKVEDYDETKNAFVPYSVDDFTYIYNDNGFPTQIVDNITYTTATTTHYTQTHNYTYK